MKTPSNELYKLIHSLSAQEKRYFKLYCGSEKTPLNYITLFDLINKEEEYNESKIKSQLKGSVSASQFKKTKNYLLEVILKFLEHHNADRSVRIQLQRNLQRIEVLLEKRLFDLAEKTIAKAEALARRYHEFYYLALLLSLKAEKITAREDLKEADNYLLKYYPEEINCLEILRNSLEFKRLRILAYKTTVTQTEASSKKPELEKLLELPILQHKKNALSLPGNLTRLMLLGNTSQLLGKWPEAYSHYHDLIKALEADPEYLRSRADFYVSVCNDWMTIMRVLGKVKERNERYKQILSFIDKLPEKFLTQRISWFKSAIQINQVVWLIESLHNKEALVESERIRKEILSTHSALLILPFHFNVAKIHFRAGNFKKTLDSINQILNHKQVGIREDAVLQAELFQVLIHYELGNEDLIPYRCKSITAKFKKAGKLTPAIKSYLLFFGKTILDAGTVTEKTELLKELQSTLSISEIEFVHFNFLSWIESKVRKKSLLEVLQSAGPSS